MTAKRHESNLRRGWRFRLGDDEAASAVSYHDYDWREVRIPHDWSIEATPDPENCEGATGYLPGGVGWYRLGFEVALPDAGRYVLVFDGVYNRSDIWVNGQHLHRQEYGYSPFRVDITDVVNRVGPNVLAVRVDRTRYCDSRWYPGSGIYRDVKLVELPEIHVPVWGTRVTTPQVSVDSSTVQISLRLANTTDQVFSGFAGIRIVAPSGEDVSTARCSCELDAEQVKDFTFDLEVPRPQLWSVKDPSRYRAETSLWLDNEEIDSVSTPFGIRAIRFDADRGFFLNEQRVPLKGVCLHHEAGLVGAAVPIGVWRRRLEKLKACGCNAIRTAHNPPSEAFLDLCDQMGFLVQHEFFDEWDSPKDKRTNYGQRQGDEITRSYSEAFAEHAEQDLKSTMLRDRNHPSVVMWSIGNEIEWCYPRYEDAAGYWETGTIDDRARDYYFSPQPPYSAEEIRQRYNNHPEDQPPLVPTARRLSGWVRELDRTRPVTANLVIPSASHQSGFTDTLDVIGYSYRSAIYEYLRNRYPDKPVLGAENWTRWHEWEAALENDAVAGVFLWTGIDYLGEAAGKWPARGSSSGLMDTAGFEKPVFHLFKSLWSDTPHVRLFTQPLASSQYEATPHRDLVEREPGAWRRQKWGWHDVNPHWHYEPGEEVVVEAYTNLDRVALSLNGRSLGGQSPRENEDRVCKWLVRFEPGELTAHDASERDSGSASHRLITPGPACGIQLTTDRETLRVGSEAVAHLVAQVVDESGVPVHRSEVPLRFSVSGPARHLGVDNGSVTGAQPFKADTIQTHLGRALTIIGAGDAVGEVEVVVSADGLRPGSATLRVVPGTAGRAVERLQ